MRTRLQYTSLASSVPDALFAIMSLCVMQGAVGQELRTMLQEAGLMQLLPGLLRQAGITEDAAMAMAFTMMMCEWITVGAAALWSRISHWPKSLGRRHVICCMVADGTTYCHLLWASHAFAGQLQRHPEVLQAAVPPTATSLWYIAIGGNAPPPAAAPLPPQPTPPTTSTISHPAGSPV
jgi:hypothetical protein